jgi:hypothetical protein
VDTGGISFVFLGKIGKLKNLEAFYALLINSAGKVDSEKMVLLI